MLILSRSLHRFLIMVGLTTMILSCATVSMEFEEGDSPEVYFQRAQTAFDQDDLSTALAIYELFLETEPADLGYVVSAEYEIAFIAYKQGRWSDARELFQALLARYEIEENLALIPAWPRVLSNRLLTIMDERQGLLESSTTDASAEAPVESSTEPAQTEPLQ